MSVLAPSAGPAVRTAQCSQAAHLRRAGVLGAGAGLKLDLKAVALRGIVRLWRRLPPAEALDDAELDALLADRGLVNRLLGSRALAGPLVLVHGAARRVVPARARNAMCAGDCGRAHPAG